MLERTVLSSLAGISFSMEKREAIAEVMTDGIEDEESREVHRLLDLEQVAMTEGTLYARAPPEEESRAEKPPAEPPATEPPSGRRQPPGASKR